MGKTIAQIPNFYLAQKNMIFNSHSLLHESKVIHHLSISDQIYQGAFSEINRDNDKNLILQNLLPT